MFIRSKNRTKRPVPGHWQCPKYIKHNNTQLHIFHRLAHDISYDAHFKWAERSTRFNDCLQTCYRRAINCCWQWVPYILFANKCWRTVLHVYKAYIYIWPLVWDEELTVRKFSALVYIKPWARVSREFMWLVVCSVVESVLLRIQDSNVLKSWSLSESLSYRLINRQKFRRVTSIIFGVMVLTHAPTKLTSRPDRIISSVSVIIIQLSSTGT